MWNIYLLFQFVRDRKKEVKTFGVFIFFFYFCIRYEEFYVLWGSGIIIRRM